MKDSFRTLRSALRSRGARATGQSRRQRQEGLLQGAPGVDALLLRLPAANDIPQFWGAWQGLLNRTTPHDTLIVYLNFLDFETSRPATEFLAIPDAQRPSQWLRNRRQVDRTPQLVLSQPKKRKVGRRSDVGRDADGRRPPALFKEVPEPVGWHPFAVALEWRGDRVGAQIAIRRTAQQGDFAAKESAFLEAVYPHSETVLNRLLASEEERARRRWLEAFDQHLPFALLFLNWEMKSLDVNQAGLEQCSWGNFGPAKAGAYQPRAVFAPPAGVAQACAVLKAEWLKQASKGRPHPAAPPRSTTRRIRVSWRRSGCRSKPTCARRIRGSSSIWKIRAACRPWTGCRRTRSSADSPWRSAKLRGPGARDWRTRKSRAGCARA